MFQILKAKNYFNLELQKNNVFIFIMFETQFA